MATRIEQLTTARDALLVRITEAVANPKPSYTVDGQTFNWTQYYEWLLKAEQQLSAIIDADGNGPLEIVVVGTTGPDFPYPFP